MSTRRIARLHKVPGDRRLRLAHASGGDEEHAGRIDAELARVERADRDRATERLERLDRWQDDRLAPDAVRIPVILAPAAGNDRAGEAMLAVALFALYGFVLGAGLVALAWWLS